MQYTSEGFRPIQDGAEIGDAYVDDCGDAAKVFARRLANRYSKRHQVMLNQDSFGDSRAAYWVTVVAPSGVVECTEHLVVTLDRI